MKATVLNRKHASLMSFYGQRFQAGLVLRWIDKRVDESRKFNAKKKRAHDAHQWLLSKAMGG